MKSTEIGGEMERQFSLGNSLEVKIEVELDRIDQAILSIFSSHPNRTYKVHQIKTILDYQNITLTPQKIEKRLDFFVITTILGKKKGSRVYSYFLR